MKPMTLLHLNTMDSVKVAIFDLSIEDVNERRERRLIAESKALAARVLGLASINKLEAIILKREHLTWNGRKVAVRYEHPKYDQPCEQNSPKTESQPSVQG